VSSAKQFPGQAQGARGYFAALAALRGETEQVGGGNARREDRRAFAREPLDRDGIGPALPECGLPVVIVDALAQPLNDAFTREDETTPVPRLQTEDPRSRPDATGVRRRA